MAFCKENLYGYDILAAVYIAATIIIARIYDFKINFSLVFASKYDIKFMKLVILFIALDSLVILLQVHRKRRVERKTRLFRTLVARKYLNFRQLFHIFKVLLWLKLVLFAYCNIKQAIPFINPHIYDNLLLKADRFMFFGHDAYAVLIAMFGNPVVTALIDKLYVLWYIVKPFVLVYFASLPVRASVAHKRFFLAYFAMWIFGGLSAVLLPSLGPIYFYPDAYSHIVKPYATRLQTNLGIHYFDALRHPHSYKVFIYEGIAAFPSLHVGIIAVFAFFLYKRSRTIGWLMFGYLLIIQIGSVVLGWHYFIDGLFAIALAFLFYKLTEKIIPGGSVALDAAATEGPLSPLEEEPGGSDSATGDATGTSA